MKVGWVLIEVIRPGIEHLFGGRVFRGSPGRRHNRDTILVSLNERHVCSSVANKLLLDVGVYNAFKLDFFRFVVLQPLPLREIHRVVVLVSKRLFKMLVSISSPYFEADLIVIKIRSPFVLLLLFVSMSITRLGLLRVSKPNMCFLSKLIWADTLRTINAFMVRCRSSLQKVIYIFLTNENSIRVQLNYFRWPWFDCLR